MYVLRCQESTSLLIVGMLVHAVVGDGPGHYDGAAAGDTFCRRRYTFDGVRKDHGDGDG